jgi:hypothetical protein
VVGRYVEKKSQIYDKENVKVQLCYLFKNRKLVTDPTFKNAKYKLFVPKP